MKLILSPTAGLPGAHETVISVSGDTLTVDGNTYNLSAVPEGGEATPEGGDHPFTGKITRQNGEIHATLRVVLGDDAASDQPTDWSHWTVTVTNGPVTIPTIRKPVEEVTE